jgi:carbonic anhydrase
MKIRSACTATAIALAIAAGTGPAGAAEGAHPHWAYEGPGAPAHWSELEPGFASCGIGREQSPIDIRDARPADLPALQFGYHAVPLNIVDNGHTVQVNYPPGSTLTVGEKTYALKQFHFHRPSEERVNGKSFALVAHLVHADAEGKLGVVAVLFQEGATRSGLLDTLWANVPSEKDKAVAVPAEPINVKDLLPATTGYYNFAGSLTTPPCSEGVTWFVLKTPVSISKSQVRAFAKLYPHNSRPVQPVNGRLVLQTRDTQP